MLKKNNFIALTEKEVENFLVNKGAKIYNNYGTLVWDHCLYELSEDLVDWEVFH